MMEILTLLSRKIGNFIVTHILFGSLKNSIEPDSDLSSIFGFSVTVISLVFLVWIAMLVTT
jgi:hypothetical protein